MSATFEVATDEILALFKTAWDAQSLTAIYQNTGDQDIPTGTASWARVNLQHIGGRQSSLAGAGSTTRWDRDGLLTIQVFTAVGEKGLSRAHQLGKVIADAYEGAATASGVWFRNVRLNEVGPDGEWFQVNVLIEFRYDEIK